MDNLTTIFTILVVISMANSGHGACTLEKSVGDNEVYITCVDSLENIGMFVPEYKIVPAGYDYDEYGRYRQREEHVRRNIKVHLNISNVDLDSVWKNEYNYMDENMETVTMNEIGSIPNKISDFVNLKELKIGNGNVIDQINLKTFLSLTNLIEINVRGSFVKTIHANHDSRTSKVNVIDLSYNLIESLPNSCFASFPQLSRLDLSYNSIKSFDILTFEGIQNLQDLDISYNRIEEIGHNFVRFVNVKKIHLNNNNLIKIAEPNFITMTKLIKLDLSNNQINEIEDKSFQNLENIAQLDLSNNKLTKITKSALQNTTNLQELNLSNNPIQKFDSEAFKGKNISVFDINKVNLIGAIVKSTFDGIITDSLDLSYMKVESLEPEAFSGLHTRTLNMSHNILKYISKTSFSFVRYLEELDLSYNNLTSIDFETSDLKELITFNAKNNRIDKINKSFFENFESLTIMDLSYNKIIQLEPELFSKLNKLQIIDISNNLLANTLMTNTFHGLSSVKYIQLNNNRFTSIQNKTFEGLKSLISINCSYGELSSIEYEAFQNTGSLEVLDFSHNLLQKFDVNFTSIDSVKELRINDNAISNVTTEMGKIEKLNLANNKIIKLQSKVFASCKNLRSLDLSSNNEIMFEDIFESITFLPELLVINIKKQIVFENITNVSISSLDMSYNDIENMNEIFIYKINGIESLTLKSNKISSIDRFSFQSMPALIYLDLSYNLITFIQPGSFLHTNALKSLNLHGNNIPALQFGVLDGLQNLEILNISSNVIHEFGKTILHNTPAITTIALDDNVIQHIQFEDFISSEIKTMTIGGNPISCHDIADIKKRNDIFTITAETLDYHNENVDGIKCFTNYVFNKTFSFPDNKSDFNGTASFWMLAKAIDGFRTSIENFRSTLDKLNISNETQTNVTQKDILDILHSIDNHTMNNSNENISAQLDLINRNIASIGPYIRNATKHPYTYTNKVSNNTDYNLQQTINMLNEEKDRMVKELHSHFANLKEDFNIKSDAQLKANNDHNGQSVMYFIAVCLMILVVLSLFVIVYIVLQRKRQMHREGYHYCSTQPITNAMELQNS